MFIKNKMINHILQKGKKTKSEKIINKSLKELQKYSKKSIKKIIQLSIVLSSVIFKTHIITPHFNIRPIFINNKKKIFFFGLKLIVSGAKKNYSNCFHNKLKEKIFSTTQLKNNTIKNKELAENNISSKKHLFKYFKWI